MNRKYIITQYKNYTIGMLIENNKETRIEVYQDEQPYYVDEIYVGRVRDVVPNINAAFVEIRPQTVCYMSLNEKFEPIFLNRKNTTKVCQGDLILVQVKKEPVKTKAGVVSCGINLSGRNIVLTREMADNVGASRKITNQARIKEIKSLVASYVNDDYGYVIRTDAEQASDDEIISELNKLNSEYYELIRIAATRTAHTLMKAASTPVVKDVCELHFDEEDEIVTDLESVYTSLINASAGNVRLYNDDMLSLSKLYSVEHRIENALSKHVWLKTGGYLIIEPTEAMTVIDVNTGKFDGNNKDREKTFYKINSEAVMEIARQLKLRNLSGIVIIDFINMEDENNRRELQKQLEKELAKDSVRTAFVDFTKLGLAEVTRKKIKRPLHEVLQHSNN